MDIIMNHINGYCSKHGIEYEQGGCWLCAQIFSWFRKLKF